MKCLNMNITHCVLIIIIIIILLIKYFISTKTKEGFISKLKFNNLFGTDETKLKNDARCYYEDNTDIHKGAGYNPSNTEWLKDHYIKYGSTEQESRRWGCIFSRWQYVAKAGLLAIERVNAATTKCNEDKNAATDKCNKDKNAATDKCNKDKKAATDKCNKDKNAATAAAAKCNEEKNDLESKNTDLTMKLNAANVENLACGSLKTKNAQLVKDKTDLVTKNAQLTTQNSTLEKENAQLPIEIENAIQSRIETSRDIYLKVPLVKHIDDQNIDISTVQCVDNKMAPVACPSWWILS